MATKDEILNAIKIVSDFAGNPDSGVVADLLKELGKSVEKTSTPTNEVRVVEAKEIR
jgi:hypothetical protein